MIEIKHRIIGALIALGISIAIPMIIHADNQDVMDNANVLNNQTEQYIKQVNDKGLAKVKGHPQIAVITEKQVDGDIEAKAQQLFNKYQFGRKGYDNGILLLIDVGDHKVRMQTGYGIESAVPDDFVNQLMNDRVQNDFRKKDYSTGTRVMVGKLSKRIITHKSELRSKSDVNNHQAIIDQQNAKRKQVEHIIGYIILILIFTGWFTVLIYLISKIVKKTIQKDYAKLVIKQNAKQAVSVINAKLLDQHLGQYQVSPDLSKQDMENIMHLASLSGNYNHIENMDIKGWMIGTFNLIVINRIIDGVRGTDYTFIVPGKSTRNSKVAEALINNLILDKPLDNYQEIAHAIVKFNLDKDRLLGLADNLTNKDVTSFNEKLNSCFDDIRSRFTYVSDQQIKDVIDSNKITKEELIKSIKYNIRNLYSHELLPQYLEGDSFEIKGTFDDIVKNVVSTVKDHILSDVTAEDTALYNDKINDEFNQKCSAYDLRLYVSSDELAELDNLTTDEKLRAIKQKDKLSFVSVVSLMLISYATARLFSSRDTSSYTGYDSYDGDWEDDDNDYHSHHHNHFDDDSGWGSGSGGFFGSSDDGGSFGGFGGFSGGGGGTAGW